MIAAAEATIMGEGVRLTRYEHGDGALVREIDRRGVETWFAIERGFRSDYFATAQEAERWLVRT